MANAASEALSVGKVLDSVMRDDRGRLTAALIARLGDFALAEEALQDALISAMSHWGRNGVPSSPRGWLLQVAHRKAIDRLRTSKAQRRVASSVAELTPHMDSPPDDKGETIPDQRLRLIFTCCHPALETKSQVALTLRTLGGLSTAEIARAFLDQETTMGQRLSRAKAKIAAARIPYAVPEPDEWPARLNSVLTVVYLIFNAGYSAGPDAGRDLADEAIWLGRMLDQLRPGDPEIEGLLALMLLTHARRGARLDDAGATVPLHRQERSRWNRAAIAEGVALIERALSRGRPAAFQVKAAIAACHCEGERSDWQQITALYATLLQFEPTAIVRLNHAVARAEAGDPEGGLAAIDALEAELADYQPFHAARAAIMTMLGRHGEAVAEYDRAIALASSQADVLFLTERRAALGDQPIAQD